MQPGFHLSKRWLIAIIFTKYPLLKNYNLKVHQIYKQCYLNLDKFGWETYITNVFLNRSLYN